MCAMTDTPTAGCDLTAMSNKMHQVRRCIKYTLQGFYILVLHLPHSRLPYDSKVQQYALCYKKACLPCSLNRSDCLAKAHLRVLGRHQRQKFTTWQIRNVALVFKGSSSEILSVNALPAESVRKRLFAIVLSHLQSAGRVAFSPPLTRCTTGEQKWHLLHYQFAGSYKK